MKEIKPYAGTGFCRRNIKPENLRMAVYTVRALNNAKRMRILELLLPGEMNVTDIYCAIRMGQSECSLHLTYMRKSRILSTKRIGREIYYSLNKERMSQIVAAIKTFCEK